MAIFKTTKTIHARSVASLLIALMSAGLGVNAGLATEKPSKPAAKPSAAQVKSGEEAFKQGNALAEKQRYKEASVQYERALLVFPKEPSVLWNAALSAYQSKNYRRALVLWQQLKGIEPNDGQVRAKLIQTYQALSLLKERNAERKALFELRKSGKDPELSKQDEYCREQFQINGRDIFVYELFELSGERALRYRFIVLKADGTTDYIISLGSYQLTTEYAREAGTISEDQRLFHLDSYHDMGRTHFTYALFTEEPSYTETRAAVTRIVTGAQKPISGSKRPD